METSAVGPTEIESSEQCSVQSGVNESSTGTEENPVLACVVGEHQEEERDVDCEGKEKAEKGEGEKKEEEEQGEGEGEDGEEEDMENDEEGEDREDWEEGKEGEDEVEGERGEREEGEKDADVTEIATDTMEAEASLVNAADGAVMVEEEKTCEDEEDTDDVGSTDVALGDDQNIVAVQGVETEAKGYERKLQSATDVVGSEKASGGVALDGEEAKWICGVEENCNADNRVAIEGSNGVTQGLSVSTVEDDAIGAVKNAEFKKPDKSQVADRKTENDAERAENEMLCEQMGTL